MHEKDLSQRQLENHNDIFADIINVLIYDGQEIINPGLLVPVENHKNYKIDGKQRELVRDVAKSYNNREFRIACCGIENQSKIDKFMPVRVMAYDALYYFGQILELEEKAKIIRDEKKRTGNKKRGCKRQRLQWNIYPVNTLVLYFGKRKWKKPFSLADCVENFSGANYNITVVSLYELSQEVINKFKSDFYIIADFVANHEKTDYEFPDRKIIHERDVFNALEAISGDNSIGEVYNNGGNNGKGGNEHMGDFFKEYMRRKVRAAMDEGLEQGKEQGIEKGFENSSVSAAKNMIEDGKLSFEDIAKYVNLSVERVKELAAEVCVVSGK